MSEIQNDQPVLIEGEKGHRRARGVTKILKKIVICSLIVSGRLATNSIMNSLSTRLNAANDSPSDLFPAFWLLRKSAFPHQIKTLLRIQEDSSQRGAGGVFDFVASKSRILPLDQANMNRKDRIHTGDELVRRTNTLLLAVRGSQF